MADTIRQRSDLLTLFADNTSGDISPQDARDFIVTALGGYGGVYTINATTTAVACSLGVERTLPSFDVAMPVSGVVTDTVNGTLTVPATGVYQVILDISLESDTNNTSAELYIAVNGVSTPYESERFFSTSGATGFMAIHGFSSLTAGDVLSVRVKADKNCNIQVNYGQFSCKMKG